MRIDAAKPVDGLLVKLRRADASAFASGNRAAVGGSDLDIVLTVHAAGGEARGFADHPGDAVWARMASGGNAWDDAHRVMRQGFAASNGVLAAEPDFGQVWSNGEADTAAGMGAVAADRCAARPQTGEGGRAIGPHDAWHLDAAFSGLGAARTAVADAAQRGVRIAHLDTGYDPAHSAKPAHLLTALERNFVTGEGQPGSAADATPGSGGIPFTRARGHGTGTISILAGPVNGGAPGAEVLAIRIADGVVRFSTSTMVQGIEHALANGAQVLSMSMGGLAGGALADAVNKAYEAGLTMVTAAGNNFAGLPIRSVVYPARMRRVIAATGVMANGKPYFDLTGGTMQGCWGPDAKMATALGGWTPNIPWAAIGCPNTLNQDGQGTSAATPQVAAAAALWIAKHQGDPVYRNYPAKWMRVEAVRRALFAAAHPAPGGLDAAAVRQFLGAGALDAAAALAIGPAAAASLVAEPSASAAWAWLRLLSGDGVGFAAVSAPRANALGLELMQLAQQSQQIEAALLTGDPDADDGPGDDARRAFFEAVVDSGKASRLLTATLQRALLTDSVVSLGAPPELPPSLPVGRARRTRAPRLDPEPAVRRLRVFALDPSLGASIDTLAIKTATVSVPYETDSHGKSLLKPGPVGEYLEIVDVDPASDRAYHPVNLDDPHLLLTDGLEPSEGDPQFHQQMVYAIAMKTIGHFEDALGRKALWAERYDRSGDRLKVEYVPRLRIYPHALRDENAFYSPDKVALLLGYFPARTAPGATVVNRSMVFACLSADIVAHEMTHALLDGVHRHYQERSNADVAAFHEAFADIVALFQHFTYGDIVRHAIAEARGHLDAAGLLSGLARQFGTGSGRNGPLRDYIDPLTGGLKIGDTPEAHARGSILVFAIYEAFLAIVERRTGDLIRLATGGTGVLPAGDLHPGLVERLTRETCKAASQLLRICIRALDYCPPADITFGAYCRALMTADTDHVPVDTLGYRTALLAAFRRHDLLPDRLRTVSVETLVWRKPRRPNPAWLKAAVDAFDIDWANNGSRWTAFTLIDKRRHALQNLLAEAFADKDLCASYGLQHELGEFDETGKAVTGKWATTFKVESLRRVRRAQPDGEVSNQIVAVIAQRRPEPVVEGAAIENCARGEWFWFRGGATLIIDPAVSGSYPARAEIRYVITKSMLSTERLAAQRAYAAAPPGSQMRAQYFDTEALARVEPFAMLHVEAQAARDVRDAVVAAKAADDEAAAVKDSRK